MAAHCNDVPQKLGGGPLEVEVSESTETESHIAPIPLEPEPTEIQLTLLLPFRVPELQWTQHSTSGIYAKPLTVVGIRAWFRLPQDHRNDGKVSRLLRLIIASKTL